MKWQDNISKSLSQSPSSSTSSDTLTSRIKEWSARPRSDSPAEPVRQRRRLDTPLSQSSQTDVDWNELHVNGERESIYQIYNIPEEICGEDPRQSAYRLCRAARLGEEINDGLDDCADAFGNLSLDENREVGVVHLGECDLVTI